MSKWRIVDSLDRQAHSREWLDRVALYGTFDLTRDKQGLAHARALKALLDQVVQVLEADKALPDAVPAPAAPGTVDNPFG